MKFEDRDIFNQEPAGMVARAYEVTEDECLNICQSDIAVIEKIVLK